jgi:hypothetical protein
MKPELVKEDDEHIVYDIGVELPPKDYETHRVYRSLVTRFIYNKQNNTASCVTSYEVEGGHTIVAVSGTPPLVPTMPIPLWEQITGHNL